MRETTVIIIWVAIVALIAWDLFMVANGKPGDTISEVMLQQAQRHPILAFAMGVVAGHLYWGQR
jgi:hypothetical protein